MKKQATWVLPLLLALVAGALVYLGIQRASGKLPVVEAKRPISPGTSINENDAPSEEYFRVVRVQRDAIPPGSFKSLEDVYSRGLMAVRYLPKGSRPMLGVDLKSEVLSVPPGMLGVTVPVDAVSGVGGFLQPRDYVDVLATVKSDSSDEAETKTILRRVQVLAVGTRAAGAAQGRSIQNVKGEDAQKPEVAVQPNATLAVTPEQAQVLTLYDSLGKLRLAKRNPSDTGAGPLPVARWQPAKPERRATPTVAYRPMAAQPVSGPSIQPPLVGSRPAPVAIPSTYKIAVYRGAEKSEVEVAEPTAGGGR